jgi:hypothetical protein
LGLLDQNSLLGERSPHAALIPDEERLAEGVFLELLIMNKTKKIES